MGTKERLEILTEHYKSFFPDDIEAIVMTEEDYERQFGNTFESITQEAVINQLLKRISNLEFEVEERDRRIGKAIEYIENNTLVEYRKVIAILKGSDKE